MTTHRLWSFLGSFLGSCLGPFLGPCLAVMLASACTGNAAEREHAATHAYPGISITGESYKHRRGEPVPATSAIFDGRTVTLRGARGETLGMSVLLAGDRGHGQGSSAGTSERAVTVELTVPGVEVQPFRVDWIQVTRPSTWMYGPSRGPGWYPDRLEPTDTAVITNQAAYFDISITAHAPAGHYRGTVRVGNTHIPLQLSIEPITIDLYPEPLVWVWYMPSELALSHGLAADSPEALELERRYARLFRAHGAYSAGALWPEQILPRLELIDRVPYVPVYIDRNGDKQRMQADIRAWIDFFRDRPNTPFAIPIDEPRTPESILRVKQWSQWAREAGAGGDRFLYAVTDQPRLLYGDTVDVFISWKGIPRRPPLHAGQRWTYNGMPGHAGSMIIDTDGIALRTWGWLAERYDVPLWYAWAGMYYRDVYGRKHTQQTDVLVDPVTFSDGTDWGNGDGLLAYPGALPSLRLKALRRGLQDRLLLKMLSACGARERAFAITLRLIPYAFAEARHGAEPTWPTHEEPWEAARAELYDAIRAACGTE